MKKLLRFNLIVWILAAGVALFLVAEPPVMDYLAKSRWKETPCHIQADTSRYFYEVNGATYNTTRRDFWQSNGFGRGVAQKHAMPLDLKINGTCWVHPRDPEKSVLALDAHSNFAHSGGKIAAAALLLAGAFILTFFSGKPKAKPPAA